MEMGQFLLQLKQSLMELTAPLSRPIFIYANNTAKDREEVKEFVEFYLNNVEIL